MTAEQKIKELIEDDLAFLATLNPNLQISRPADRDVIARQLADTLMESRPSYRSGRRISDRLRDKLIDVQRWIKRQ